MNTKIVTIITDTGIGGTFLSWSIEYLLGHDSVYNVRKCAVLDLTDNPLNASLNAHGFTANQCHADEIHAFVKALLKRTEDFSTIYFHRPDDISMNSNGYYAYNNAKRIVEDLNMPVITVQLPKQYVLYHSLYAKRHTAVGDDSLITTYFSHDKKMWEEMKLTEVYDTREFLALNIRPFTLTETRIDVKKAHRMVAPDLWINLHNAIFVLADYLKKSIISERYDKWIDVYCEWKQVHTKRMEWCWYFDEIIESIINGYDMNLDRFELDLYQEATIQHVLIYTYGLNLKTYKLYSFKNTLQLHNLLEPCGHKIKNDYQT